MSQEEDIKKIWKRLEDIEGRLQKLEKQADEKKIEVKPEKGKPEEAVKELAKKTGVSEVDIKKIFDVEEDSLTLVRIVGKDDKEKTINITLLVLLGYKYFFKTDDVFAKEIRRNVAENKISIYGFANHLKEIIPKFIRRKGKIKSPNTTYRLTTLGEVEARELLKKMCEGQE
jgi:hypothetical protein